MQYAETVMFWVHFVISSIHYSSCRCVHLYPWCAVWSTSAVTQFSCSVLYQRYPVFLCTVYICQPRLFRNGNIHPLLQAPHSTTQALPTGNMMSPHSPVTIRPPWPPTELAVKGDGWVISIPDTKQDRGCDLRHCLILNRNASHLCMRTHD
jgi:hypothetical protein